MFVKQRTDQLDIKWVQPFAKRASNINFTLSPNWNLHTLANRCLFDAIFPICAFTREESLYKYTTQTQHREFAMIKQYEISKAIICEGVYFATVQRPDGSRDWNPRKRFERQAQNSFFRKIAPWTGRTSESNDGGQWCGGKWRRIAFHIEPSFIVSSMEIRQVFSLRSSPTKTSGK